MRTDTWQFFVTFLGWESDPGGLSDLQVGNQNHFEPPGKCSFPGGSEWLKSMRSCSKRSGTPFRPPTMQCSKYLSLQILAHRNWEWFQETLVPYVSEVMEYTPTPILIIWRSVIESLGFCWPTWHVVFAAFLFRLLGAKGSGWLAFWNWMGFFTSQDYTYSYSTLEI